ncbi:MAG TPA: fluoride efflux transporter CrcB [Mucilaginibacter sp.]|jgi:CrcB protein|nr:fluoride efflux transporter CrcB [Mucilaginibacter sp.]
MKNLLLIFTGGGIGSLFRFGLSRFINKMTISPFPYGTFIVNIIGCFLIGFIIFYTERYGDKAEQWRFFLATGLCGGFTTFSTFSLENVQLLNDQRILLFLAYTIGSVAIGILATYGGLLLAKHV